MHTSRLSFTVPAGLLSLLVACGGSSASGHDSNPDPSGSGTGSDGGATNRPAPVGSSTASGSSGQTPSPPDTTCNTTENDADWVEPQVVAAAAPGATGGSITPGKYRLAKATVFTGQGGEAGAPVSPMKETISIQGGVLQLVVESDGSVKRMTATISPTGSTLTMTPTCPTGVPAGNVSYSAHAGKLTLFMPNNVDQIQLDLEP